MVNFHTLLDAEELKTSPHRRMLDVIVLRDVFNLRVRNAAMVFEKGRQPSASEEATLIDSRRQDGTAVLAVPDGIIGTSAKKGDTQGSASDNHV
jgi:hypothetical protein